MNKKSVKKYRKKPIVIEAYQTDKVMYIETLEGIHKADIGDYIITGVKGEQYPCKPDIFEQTYEPVEDLKGSKSTPLTWSKSTSLGGWISVKDRLPEDDKDVLVYDSGSKEIIMASYNSDYDEWSTPYDYYYDLDNDKITHWQPLPELPEAER